MDPTMRMVVEGVALSVFIAVGSWGLVRAAVVSLAAARYFQLRTERYPETAELPHPHAFARTQLIVMGGVCWAAAVVFAVVWFSGRLPSVPFIVLAALGPVAAAVGLYVSSRSPWSKLRGVLSAAARVPVERRDELVFQAFSLDPQLKESGVVRD